METQDVGSFSACVWQPDKHDSLCHMLHEALLTYPEGGSYAACEEQLAQRKGE